MCRHALPLLVVSSLMAAEPPRNFFQPKAEWTHINTSKFDAPAGVVGQEISADLISGTIYFNHLFSRRGGFRLGTGYEGLKINWSGNPLTSQKLFSLAEISAGLFLMGVDNWDVYFEIAALLSTKHTNWSTYALYRGILYTKYNYADKFNLHAGFTGYYGMRYSKVVPIIGIDFPIGPRFRVHSVFPHDIGLEYKPLSWLSAFARARIIDTPRRLSPDSLRPEGAIVYHNIGAELALKAYYQQYAGITGYVGHTIQGYVKAENRDGSDLAYYRFKTALYGGVSLFLAF